MVGKGVVCVVCWTPSRCNVTKAFQDWFLDIFSGVLSVTSNFSWVALGFFWNRFSGFPTAFQQKL